MGAVELADLALGVNLQGAHQIEAEEEQIHKIILGQPLAPQMGMEAAQPPQPPPGGPPRTQGRDHDRAMIPHQDQLHLAGTVDQQADLTADPPRNPGQGSGQFRGSNLIRLQPPPPQPLQLLQLRRFQAGSIPA